MVRKPQSLSAVFGQFQQEFINKPRDRAAMAG
jgi:hypothetical protein